MSEHEADPDDGLYKYLFYYRSTPHCTTGCTPVELQFNRPMRTRFDLIRPGLRDHVENNQRKQENNFHGNRKTEFEINDSVVANDYSKKNWRSAEIEEKKGDVIYNVRTNDNKLWVRHIDQLRLLVSNMLDHRSS